MTIFVDAADELYRRNKKLRDLWRRLSRTFDFVTGKVRIVLSARSGTWDASATKDLAALCGPHSDNTAPRLVTFEPLDTDALRTLVAAYGVSDVDLFMTSFEANELASIFELRPADAKLLASLWIRNKSHDRWSQLLTEVIEEALAKVQPHDASASVLTVVDARRSLRRVAASNVLMRLPQVSAAHVAPTTGVVSSRRLLEDLTFGQQVEFLQAPIFQSKGSHSEAMQLPQGAMTCFLAARWFSDRVRGGWSPPRPPPPLSGGSAAGS